jgi:hypothetical protein
MKLGGMLYWNQVAIRLSIHQSSYLLNLSSEIDVVDKKCSLRQRFVDQGLSRSFWKVQGHSGHIKGKSNFNTRSSYNHQRYWHEIFRNILSITGNIYNTLDMAPGVNPTPPPETRNCWISQKLLRSPPLNHINSCSLIVLQAIYATIYAIYYVWPLGSSSTMHSAFNYF